MSILSNDTLSDSSKRALAIYDCQLKALLEPQHNGSAVAIDADSGAYEIGKTHREASRLLRSRLPEGARIVTLTIGPPTPAEITMANRIMGLP